MKLQGMQPFHFTVDVPAAELGRQIGNSMSINVLQRLFARLLPAAGLLDAGSHCTEDRWQTGEAFAELVRARPRPFRNWPVPVAKRARGVESGVDIDAVP